MAINRIPPETLTDILRRTVNPPPEDISFFDWPGASELPIVALRARHRQAADAMLVSRLFRLVVVRLLREWVVLSNSSDARAILSDEQLLRSVKTIFIGEPGPSWALLSDVFRAAPNISGFHATEDVYGSTYLPCRNVAHLSAIPELFYSLPGVWAMLVFLELIDDIYSSSYMIKESFPCLVSLKIPFGDRTMINCSMKALRNLCIAPGDNRYTLDTAGTRSLEFLLAHGENLHQLEFTPFVIPLSAANPGLVVLCPHLKQLVVDVGGIFDLGDPLWDMTLFGGRPTHSLVVEIGLRNISEIVGSEGARLYIEELIEQDRFPALRGVRDLGCRSTREGPVWAAILVACTVRGVFFTDWAGNVTNV